MRQSLIKRLGDSQLEEEMRVLYVAMTRARERLYITAEVEDPEKFTSSCTRDAEKLSRYVIMKNGGYMKWLLTAAEHYIMTHDDEPPFTLEIAKPSVNESEPITETAEAAHDTASDEAWLKLVRDHFDFEYPKAASSKLPAKLSVSKLVPDLLDETTAELPEPYEPFSFTEKRPKFLDGLAYDTPTGAERGTATHLFMQFCDFSRFADFNSDIAQTVKDEAARLAQKHFFTSRIASLVNVKQIAAFFEGDTFARLCSSKSVRREHRFNVKLPASDFTEDPELSKALADEKILVQGVIDCFFENPDGTLTLIDYKTDFIPSELSPSEAEAMLLERHRLQLLYYKAALERISAKKVASVAIYSFALGREITVE